MKCKNCGADIPVNAQKCPACGWEKPEAVSVVLNITPSEARNGCIKTLQSPVLAKPLRLRLKPGIQSGKVLVVSSARVLDESGLEAERPVRIQIVVTKGKFTKARGKNSRGKWVLAVAAVVGILGLAFAIWQAAALLQNALGSSQGTTPSGSQNGDTQPEATYTPTVQMPHKDQRFFLNQLGGDAQANVYAMYDSLMTFQENCTLPAPVSAEELSGLLLLLKYECPEILQVELSDEVQIMQNQNTGLVESVQWSYRMTQEDYTANRAACQGVVDALVASVSGMGEWEKEKVAFDFIANSCYYNETGENAGNAMGVLVNCQAKCDGISNAMKWILEDMGLSCFTLSGMPSEGTVGHAWNVVSIDGTYYDVDVTADVRKEGVEKPILYQAYNTSNTWVRSSYTLHGAYSQFGEIPGAQDMSGSYYADREWFVGSGENADTLLDELFYDAACDGRGYFSVQFESKVDMDNFTKNLENFMSERAQAHDVSNLQWESMTFESYHVVYVKIVE